MAWAVWLTGLPGSGKSAITMSLSERLRTHNISFDIIRMDELRSLVTPNPSYSEEERDIVYSALVYAALLLTRNNVNVIIDATGNKRRYREKARKLIPLFIEVYVKCPLEICIERERLREERWGAPENIYDKSFKGLSRSVPGINIAYEEPLKADVIVDSSRLDIKEAAQIIYLALENKFK